MAKGKKYILFAVQIISAAVLVVIDQLTKKLAVDNLMGKEEQFQFSFF